MIIENSCLTRVSNNEIVDGKFMIPDSVTSIGDFAFEDCSKLTNVTIPDSMTSIGSNAFYNCSGLTNVTIPDSVTSIGSAAFSGCSGLTSITIPFVGNRAGVTASDTYQYTFGYIFGTSSYTGGTKTEQYYYGSSKSSTTHDTYYIPSSLMSVTVTGGNILYGAFYNCSGLTSVTIGNSVTSIGSYAFSWCTGLTSVVIPDSVTSIGEKAFVCCALTSKQTNYKAFQGKNGKLRCRRKTYSEGKKHYVRGTLKMCENGIHYCTNLFEIFNYYHGELDKDIAIYEIEVGSKILTSDSSKCCTNSCVLKRRLHREDIIKILNGKEV